MGNAHGAETPKQFLELEGTPIVIRAARIAAVLQVLQTSIVATRADEVGGSRD